LKSWGTVGKERPTWPEGKGRGWEFHTEFHMAGRLMVASRNSVAIGPTKH
jgi:hypothetical protein